MFSAGGVPVVCLGTASASDDAGDLVGGGALGGAEGVVVAGEPLVPEHLAGGARHAAEAASGAARGALILGDRVARDELLAGRAQQEEAHEPSHKPDDVVDDRGGRQVRARRLVAVVLRESGAIVGGTSRLAASWHGSGRGGRDF